ncbi:unnamed protein product [Cochlearia groenlandica]
MSKSIQILFIALLVVLSPIFDAKIVCSMSCEYAKKAVQVACLEADVSDDVNKPMPDCCNAIKNVNKEAKTTQARQQLCKCFQDAIKIHKFKSFVGLPERCDIPTSVPFDDTTDCAR